MRNLYDLRSLQRSKHLRYMCLVVLGVVYSFQVSAQTTSLDQAAYDRFMWSVTGGNQTTVNYGGNGQVVVSPAGSPMPVERAETTSGNDVGYSGSGTKTNPSGNKVPIGVSAKVLGSAAAKIIGAALGIAGAVQTASALYDLCRELGFGCGGKDANGQPLITRETTSQSFCSYTPNYNCGTAANGGEFLRVRGCTGIYWNGWQYACGHPFYTGADAQGPATTTNAPATAQEVEDAIVRKTTGWPLTSTVHKALEEAAKATGQKVPLTSPKVTGPATSPGTTKTTVDPAKNTTTTTGVTHNHYYSDNRVTTTTTTSSNVTNNTTGVGETTTTTEEPVEEESECQKNPTSLNCADLDTPEGEIPRVEKLITFNPENLGFGGGSCPANVVQNIAGKPVTIVDWAQNCSYITTYAKPIILVSATFAALMIIFLGGKPE